MFCVQTIRNAKLHLTLDSKRVVSEIVNVEANVTWSLMCSNEAESFFLVKKGDSWFGSKDFDGTIDIYDTDFAVWKGESWGMTVLSEVKVEGKTLLCNFSVANYSDTQIDAVVLPRLIFSCQEQLKPGIFVWPFQNGALISEDEFEAGESVNLIYPIYASMQWMQYYAQCNGKMCQQGLYLGSHDKTPYFKILRIGKKGKEAFMEFEYPGLELMPGEKWTSPEFVIAPCSGDWRWGARFYGDWAHSWMLNPQPPDWHANNPVMHGVMVKDQFASAPRMSFKDLPKSLDKYKKHGVDTLNVVGWIEGGHDSNYPDYVPGPSMGGTDGLEDAIARIHDDGGHVFLYTNGRLLSLESSISHKIPDWSVKCGDDSAIQVMTCSLFAETTGSGGAGWNPASVIATGDLTGDTSSVMALEKWGKVTYAIGCPSVREWQESLIMSIETLLRKCKPDGFQVDQIGGCWAYLCFDNQHRHKKPYEAWSFYREFSDCLRMRVKAIDPKCFVWTEGVCDVIGSYYDAEQFNVTFDSVLKGKGTMWPFVYRYSFPERIIYSHANSRDIELSALAFLLGGGFFVHLGEPSVNSKTFIASHPATQHLPIPLATTAA